MTNESSRPDAVKPRTWQRANVLALSLAAFFNDMGSDMLFAFYPLFVVMVIGVSDMKVVGLIDSVGLLLGVMGLLVRPVAGRIADRYGRKHFIWTGYVMLIAARVWQGAATVWQHLIPPQVLYQLGRGIRNPARQALMTDSVPQEERGFAFGILESMDTAGAILGPILGIGLFSLYASMGFDSPARFRLVFFSAALPTFVSVAIVLTRVRDVLPAGGPGNKLPRRFSGVAILSDRCLTLFTAASCLFSLWAVTENFMLICGAKILGLQKQAIWPAVILYWFINVTYAPSALLAGRLSDRVGRKDFIVAGWLLLGTLTLGFLAVKSFWAIGILFACHGIHQGLVKPCQIALVADLAPDNRRGEVLGTYSMLTGIFAIPGPFVFGALWDAAGKGLPFLISGICVIASAAILLLFVPSEKGKKTPGVT